MPPRAPRPAGSVRRRIEFDAETWHVLHKLSLDSMKSLQDLAEEAFRDLLKKTELFDEVAPRVWKKECVVHSEPVGSGEAAFKYLAPYVFRVAISNSRILKLEDGRVTFKYKDSATDQVKFATVSAEEFMRRFLHSPGFALSSLAFWF